MHGPERKEAEDAANLGGLSLVRVSKVSGPAFLDAAGAAWREREILLIGDNEQLGIAPSRSLDCAAGGGWWEGDFDPDPEEAWAQISSTSGTTGPPKAIALSRRAVSDTIERLLRHMEIDGGIREYIGVPVTFSFGLGRARAVAAAGGAAYLPANGFRPDEIGALLRDGSINALSAVPTMLRTILTHPELIGTAGHRLRWLEIGSQYMAASEKRAVRETFPQAVILQHYGLTEASRSTFLRIDTADEAALASVGSPVDGGEIRIDGSGRIEVRGPHLASGAIAGGELVPLTGPNGWLRTTDLGELRDGRLYYIGRADDVANIGGVKVSADMFESLLSQRLMNGESIGVCVIRDALRGERLAIACPRGARARISQAVKECAAEQGLVAGDLAVVEVEELPRTATGKVQRGVLARQIEAEAGQAEGEDASAPAGDAMTPREAEIAAIWAEALRVRQIARDDSFFDLGGDSLSAVGVMLQVEKAGLSSDVMERMFAGETVAQIAAALDAGHGEITTDIRAVRADALNAVRGLFAMVIVVAHWGPFLAERLGAFGNTVWTVLGPMLRIGTPGFAMVYGMGLGLFFFGQIDRGPQRLRKRIRNNTILLVAGVLLVAGTQAWRIIATGEDFGPIWPERLFYTVLLFYALIVPSSLFWLRRVAAARDGVFASLLLALGAYGFHALCAALVPVNPFTGWASLGWHMLVAPYAYPRLLGAVALGLAMALWLQRSDTREGLVGGTAKWGVILGGLGFLLVAFLPGGWSANAGEVAAIPAFAGTAALLYAGAAWVASEGRRPLTLQIAMVCGMLAFPIFVGHGIVLPAKDLLVAYGMTKTAAMLLPALLFAGAMLWLGVRIHRLMFASVKRG